MISGRENIPRDKAILFVANHQNALIDPLLIGAVTPRELNFLTRADVFGKPVIKALLSTVNMLPIYRIRDGLTSVSKNEEVFKKCYRILNQNGTVLIFPEGNHNIRRQLRSLSKGFTRIVFGTLESNPDQQIVVLPIGINYTNAKKFASSVHLIFGEPIPVTEKYNDDLVNGSSNRLKDEVSAALKKLITHVDDPDHHDNMTSWFHEEEFLQPEVVNQKLKDNSLDTKDPVHMKKDKFNLLGPVVRANSIIPLLVWKFFFPKIEEEEFIATYRFSLGITLVPLCYFLQAWLVSVLWNDTIGMMYLAGSFLSAYLFVKSN
jgi:1-acyl-sn-glycerol-3-phosphate acyltransferase